MLTMTQEGGRRLLPLARCCQPPAAAGSAPPMRGEHYQLHQHHQHGRRHAAMAPPPAARTAAAGTDSVAAAAAAAVTATTVVSADSQPRKLKLESEDSSYDSDYELPPPGSATDHEDVSRTVSDTLGAEFAEYVSTGGSGGGGDVVDYKAKVGFAFKLGFTEEHVHRALHKLGSCPADDDFLKELIRVGSDARAVVGGDVDEEDPTAAAAAKLRISVEPSAREDPSNLRHIVVDGSNVAMSHGNKEQFSCRGIRLAVEYFRARGHQGITVFVPMWRKEAPRPDTPITDQEVLLELERERVLVFTPSRVVDGKRITCYDDRYILQTAQDQDGVVVSNDNYRDLHKEKQFKKIIEERILMYSFANDRFMPPDDPLGRNGPTLDNFLRKTPRPSESLCPYGKKCTYGNKCKYYHPERGNQPQKTVTEKLAEHAQRCRRSLADVSAGGGRSVRDKTLSLPAVEARSSAASSTPSGGGSGGGVGGGQVRNKQPVSRTRSLVPGSGPAETGPTAAAVAVTGDGPQLRSAAMSRSMENVASASRLRSVPIDPASYDPAAAAVAAADWQHQHQQHQQQWSLQQQQQQQQQHQQHQQHPSHLHTKGVRQHSELCRKSSDPSYQSSHQAVHETQRAHKPLARQLTLYPTYDPRLAQRDHYVLALEAQLGRQQAAQAAAAAANRNLLSPHWDTSGGGGGPGGHLASGHGHASVTRIRSDPDAACRPLASGLPTSAPPGYNMQRLSSTSDPQLNVYPYHHHRQQQQQQQYSPSPAAAAPESVWHRPATSSPSAGWPGVSVTVGGDSCAPSRPPPPPQTFNLFNPNPLTASLSTPPLGGAASQPPSATAGVGGGGSQFGVLGFGAAAGAYTPDPIGTQPSSPRQSRDELRRRMYWHLSALFPEEKVRVAMNRMPDETDPNKICAEILQPQ